MIIVIKNDHDYQTIIVFVSKRKLGLGIRKMRGGQLMNRKRSISLLIAVTVLFSAVMLSGVETASAASKKTYYLPVKVTRYDKQDNSWKMQHYEKYTYNSKGDVTKYQTDIGWFAGVSEVKWTYRKGKPVKAVVTSKKRPDYTTRLKFDSKGRVSQLMTVLPLNGKKTTCGMKYSYNKKGYAYKISLINFNTSKRSNSFAYHKNGMAKRITQDGKYSYYFNNKGLVTESSGYTYKYAYDKKGRVKSVVLYTNENGKDVESRKLVFSYGKAKTNDRMKYVSMMSKMTGVNKMGEVSGHPFPEHINMN